MLCVLLQGAQASDGAIVLHSMCIQERQGAANSHCSSTNRLGLERFRLSSKMSDQYVSLKLDRCD